MSRLACSMALLASNLGLLSIVMGMVGLRLGALLGMKMSKEGSMVKDCGCTTWRGWMIFFGRVSRWKRE